MADVTGITAVKPAITARVQQVTFGATVAAGKLVYLDSSDDKYKLADADASEAAAAASAMVVTPGVDGDGGVVVISGSAELVGATLAVGAMYVASDTAGGIKPDADLSTGDYATSIGRASSATVLELDFNATGIQLP